MSCPVANFKYTGATPGADSNTYNLLDTTVVSANASGILQMAGIKRIYLDLSHSQSVQLRAYGKQDRSGTWTEIARETIAAPAAGDTTKRDYNVVPYRHFKLDAVNQGSAQTTWVPQIAGHDDNAKAG